MGDKRVCFDFEVEFENGGGLQGQGFRLDIDGDDITDEALAEYIIRDLRLLMVGRVKILNKAIIDEEHKRAITATAHSDPERSWQFADLSHRITHGMKTYPGLPEPFICDHMSFAASRSFYAAGTEFHIGKIEMVANTGTYLDSPYHRYETKSDLSGIPLPSISHVPGVIIRLLGIQDRSIDWTLLAAHDIRGRAVLLHTGWDRYWGSEQYFDGHPFLTEASAEFLRREGAALVGIDSLNIDDLGNLNRPVHSILLGADIPIVEHLTGLGQVPNQEFFFSAVPPKVSGMGTFPVRAHAFWPTSAKR